MSIIGDIASLPNAKKAQHARNRAAKKTRRAAVLQTIFNRRAFISRARSAQQENLTASIANGGNLDSSGARGVAASTTTRANQAVFQSELGQKRNDAIQMELDDAQRQDRISANFQLFGDVASAVVGAAGGGGASGGAGAAAFSSFLKS
jgi:hypothetical protein